MIYLISLLFLCYYITLGFFLIGWRKMLVFNRTPLREPLDILQSKRLISVIIPFRNEEKVIVALLNDIINQDYKSFEVILVDDHSDDKGWEIIHQHIKNDNRFMLLKNNGTGKKSAITSGVAKAKGEVIVTTDADCRLPHRWLSLMNQSFHAEPIKMVFGPVKIEPEPGFFSKLQAIEFSSLMGSGAAMFGLGHPVFCNGANLAFRKSTFEEVDGYIGNLSIPSGDDEFLMRKVIARYPEGLHFLSENEAVVSTRPSTCLATFFQQRLRWAGKWRYNSSGGAKLLAVCVLLFQLGAILSLGLLVAGVHVIFFSALWGIKIALEFIFLNRVGSFLKVKWNIFAFLCLQIVYPFYVVIVGILSNFLPFHWKGRVASPDKNRNSLSEALIQKT